LFVSAQFHPKFIDNMRELAELKRKLGTPKVEIVALINAGLRNQIAAKVAPNTAVELIWDKYEGGLGPLSHSVGVRLVPETLIIDPKGSVRVYIQNYRDMSSLNMQRCVRSLLH